MVEMLVTVKLRERKSDGGTSGRGLRVMSGTRAMVITAPSPSETKASGSDQPVACPRIPPKLSPPTASAMAAAPNQSKWPVASESLLSSMAVHAR